MVEPPSGFSSRISATTTAIAVAGGLISTIVGISMLFKTTDGSTPHFFAIFLIVAAVLLLCVLAVGWLYFSRRDGGDDGTNKPRSLREQLDNLLLRLWPEYQERMDERDGNRWRWLLVLGAEGSGKTSALSAAGFDRVEIPVVRSDGAPETSNHLPDQCRWWRHEGQRLIALEIEMSKHGLMDHRRFGRGASARWRELLRWLRRRRLVDAVIVQVGIDRFKQELEKIDEDLRRSASRGNAVSTNADELARARMKRLSEYQLDRGLPGPMRAAVDAIRYELLADIPIYLVFSHCDTMAGFLGFFDGPTPEPWGLSLPPSESSMSQGGSVPVHLGERVSDELAELRLDLETRAVRHATRGDANAAAAALTLPSEFGVYAEAIRCFIEVFASLRMQKRGLAGLWNAVFRPSSPLWLCSAYLCAPAPKVVNRDWLSAPRLLYNAGIRRIADKGEPAGNGAYFVGFFDDISAGLDHNTWLRLPRPLAAGLIPMCLASAVLAFCIGRFYHTEIDWQRRVEALSLRLHLNKNCDVVEAVSTRTQIRDLLSEQVASSFPTLRDTATKHLRQNIEEHCLLPRLRLLADARLKGPGSADCGTVLPERPESRLAMRAFKIVATLNRGLRDICSPLSSSDGDVEWLARELYDIQVPSSLNQQLQGELRKQFVYQLTPPVASGSNRDESNPYLPVDDLIVNQASCVAKRLQAAPHTNIYRIWSGKGLSSGETGAPNEFYTDRGCRGFAEILEPRWLNCIYDANRPRGPGSPEAPKTSQASSSKLQMEYKDGYQIHWKSFIAEKLWTFPSLKSQADAQIWRSVCRASDKSRYSGTEYWEIDSEVINKTWKQLHADLTDYRTRIVQLSQAVAEADEAQSLPAICVESEKDWLPLRVFSPKDPSHAALVASYLAALDESVKQLSLGLAVISKKQTEIANEFVSDTLNGKGMAKLVMAREALFRNANSLQKMELERPMIALEKDLWLVMLRLSAQDIGQKWQEIVQAYREVNNIKHTADAEKAKQEYDILVGNIKQALAGWETKLKVFCRGSVPIRSCEPDDQAKKYGARLRLAASVPGMFSSYDHIRVEKAPEPPPPPQAPPTAPAPAAVPPPSNLPSLRPLRVEALNCVETAKQSLLFLNYLPKLGPPAQLSCDRQDEKTWICPTTSASVFPGEGALALYSLIPNRRDASQELLIGRGHFDIADKCKANQIRKSGEKDRYVIDVQTDLPMASCRTASGMMQLRITFAGHCSTASATPAPSPPDARKETPRLTRLPPIPACPLELE